MEFAAREGGAQGAGAPDPVLDRTWPVWALISRKACARQTGVVIGMRGFGLKT